MKRFVAVVAAVAALGLGSATAADLPMKAPAPVLAPVYNWSGFYVGFNVGAALDPAHVQTSTIFTPTGFFAVSSPPVVAAAGDQTFRTPGFTGGIQFGYNWQMANTVFGIETDFNYMGLKGSTTNSAIYPCCAPESFTINQSVKTDWLFTLRPRLGWAMNNWLLYITGGLAVTQIKADYLFTDTFPAVESASINKIRAGWTVGGGVEFGAAGPWSVKAEYLHVDFGSTSTTSTNLLLTSFTPPFPHPSNVFTHSVHLSDDIVRVGLNYRLHP